MTLSIVKAQRQVDPRELYIAYMFAAYLRAPARKTLPGEVVDLGEIGSVPESRTWSRETPYSPAREKIE